MAKLTALQFTSSPNVLENIDTIEHLLQQCEKVEEHLVVLPECCLFFGGKDAEQLTLAQTTAQDSTLLKHLINLAQKYHCYLVGGTIPILDHGSNKFTNSSCLITPQGELLAKYDKIHLFDVAVEDSEKQYLESKYTLAGKSTVVAKTPFANLGMTVCYDLRFPELYRHLRVKHADIISVPSAFTRVTGKAHWQALLQARAIENQVYIVAAGQEGVHANGRETWGHSMIINPWGEIIAVQEQGNGIVSAEFSRDELNKIRASMPVNTHNQFKTELIPYE